MNTKIQPISEMLNQAYAAIHDGQLSVAKLILEQLLQRQHRNVSALQLLGAINAMQGSFEVAIQLLSKAIKLSPASPQLLFNRGNAYSQHGKHLLAIDDLNKSLLIAPHNADAWTAIAFSYKEIGNQLEAINCYDKALKVNPSSFRALLNKGCLLMDELRFEEAENLIQKAITVEPNSPEAFLNLGISQRGLKKFDAALSNFNLALSLKMDYAEAFYNIGEIHKIQNKMDEALYFYNKAIELKPKYKEAYISRGNIYEHTSKLDEALIDYENAKAIDAFFAVAYVGIGDVLKKMGRNQDALNSFNSAIELDSNCWAAHVGKSWIYLLMARFEEGWVLCDYRLKIGDLQNIPSGPVWNGEHSNEPLLVWGEQGIGDQILFSSILHELGALQREITVAIDGRLIELFDNKTTNVRFIDLTKIDLPSWRNQHISIASLGRIFRSNIDSFQRAIHPYLKADPVLVDMYKKQLRKTKKLVCGVSWLSISKIVGKQKSLTLSGFLSAFADLPILFVDLQYGDTLNERVAAKNELGIDVIRVDDLDPFNDLGKLAALIEACDLVVSISNTTAHLSGALNKQTYIMLPAYGQSRIWYWGEEHANPWYPSMKMYTQEKLGDWAEPLKQIRLELSKIAYEKN